MKTERHCEISDSGKKENVQRTRIREQRNRLQTEGQTPSLAEIDEECLNQDEHREIPG